MLYVIYHGNDPKVVGHQDEIIYLVSTVEKIRLETVSKLIEGFESPFGVELLATVDFGLFTRKN